MMMIMAKPVRSVKVNVSPAHATAVMVAMTGSLVPSMGGTHRADAHHACHVEPEREERAAYDGVEQQKHASRVQCGNVRPRLRERA